MSGARIAVAVVCAFLAGVTFGAGLVMQRFRLWIR